MIEREVDDARRLPFTEAPRVLSYPGERAVVERARSIVSTER
jgi:hypothetical protein